MTPQMCNVELFRPREIVKKNELKVALNLTEDVQEKIFSLSAVVKRGECRIDGDEIVYGGTVTFNAVFSAEELDRAEVGAKFTFKTEKDGECDSCSVRYGIENVETRSEGGMLYAVCELIATITLYKKEERSFVSSVDSLYKSDALFISENVPFEKEFSLDDEFTVKRIKRALSSDSYAIVTAVNCDDDFVTVDGEAVLNVCLLPFSENSDILKETRIIPFRFEIDADGVDSESVAFARAVAERTNLKILVDEDSGKTTVSASVSVLIEGRAYSKKAQNYIVDIYSPDFEIDIRSEELSLRSAVSFESGSERISQRAVCRVPEYSRLVRLIGERIEDLAYRKEGDNLVIEGVVGGSAIFSDSDNALVSSPLSLPFSVSKPIESDVEDVSVILENVSAKIRSGEIECDLTLRYSYFKAEDKKVNIITSAEIKGEKIKSEGVIGVYVGRRGDEEWDVIKTLGVPIERVYEFNENLTFPLVGGEKITVFKK